MLVYQNNFLLKRHEKGLINSEGLCEREGVEDV